jgi:hypothetical protein
MLEPGATDRRMILAHLCEPIRILWLLKCACANRLGAARTDKRVIRVRHPLLVAGHAQTGTHAATFNTAAGLDHPLMAGISAACHWVMA